MSFVKVDGPSGYESLSVGTTAVEAKITTPLNKRKALTIQPLDGTVYLGYDSSVTTSNGTRIFNRQIFTIAATYDQPVYLIAPGGTVDVRIADLG